MATTKTEPQELTSPGGERAAQGGGPRESAEGMATGLAGAASGAANTVSARLPEAAATTRAAVDEATRRMTTGSDQALTVGTAFSLGLTIGLLVGGANRILVMLAMIPAAAMGMTLLDRSGEGRARRGPA